MPSARTAKCPYQSKYSPGRHVTPAQYLAEVMCERMAARQEQKLTTQFWNRPEWKNVFLLQVRHANALFKLYSPEVVVRAVNSADGKKVYSLAAPFLRPTLQREQKMVELEASRVSVPTPEPQRDDLPAFRERPRTDTLLDRLEETN